jgi:hypothetical protein
MGVVGSIVETLITLAIVGCLVMAGTWLLFADSRAVYVANQDDATQEVTVIVEGAGQFNGGTQTYTCTVPPNSYAKVTEVQEAHFLWIAINAHHVRWQVGPDLTGPEVAASFSGGFDGRSSAIAQVEDDTEAFSEEDSYTMRRVTFYDGSNPEERSGPLYSYGEQVPC